MSATCQVIAPCFTENDAVRAWEEWGANCGPGAIAGICRMTLDEIRPHMGDFERKGYTNPSLMYAALNSIGVRFRKLGARWPTYGIVLVQWDGPWMKAGVPHVARSRHTHWIGTALINGERGVFDINCMNNGAGWVSAADWERFVVPHLVADHKGATHGYLVANGLEVECLRR